MKEKMNVRVAVLAAFTLIAGLVRVLQTTGHVPFSNFTPIGAMALFGGAYFISKPRAYLLPLVTLLISDLVLMNTVYAKYSNGFLYDGWYVTYLAFALMVLLGSKIIQKVSVQSVALAGIAAGMAHFIIVDFAVWLGGGMDVTTGLPYTRDFEGLLKCYTLALPFFKNMVASNLAYGALLFGGFELAQYKFPALKAPVAVQ